MATSIPTMKTSGRPPAPGPAFLHPGLALRRAHQRARRRDPRPYSGPSITWDRTWSQYLLDQLRTKFANSGW